MSAISCIVRPCPSASTAAARSSIRRSDSVFAHSTWNIFVSLYAIMSPAEQYCSIVLDARVNLHPYASGDDAARIDDVPRLQPLEAFSLCRQIRITSGAGGSLRL